MPVKSSNRTSDEAKTATNVAQLVYQRTRLERYAFLTIASATAAALAGILGT